MRWPAALALLLAGCDGGEQATAIDGSSPQSFQRTTEAARSDLPVGDRLDYDRALASVGTRRFADDDKAALARTTFDGMTAAQVVADYRARQQ
ncbi:MAG: hypothetical protein AVDCRST_MAG09-994 [uncultured Sphingomonas sp.]|uniref:Uncharacterized protein n=1 Tax=uncultured Sphingomonas sp. TaxID=158754 RepID=A0A6J4SPS2_9SPHN|nr:hypothetical protein [uncultured Sphingomonas sp.]CAA9500849.1 MAG: hypothetical protein AVDCRST_MAG09-994 [uncultured Sphingomonas sp.]